MTSAFSMPAIVELNSQLSRGPSPRPCRPGGVQVLDAQGGEQVLGGLQALGVLQVAGDDADAVRGRP
jgi:hypothetical protein